MAKEKPCVKLAIANDPRTRALIEGKVGVEGYELEIIQDAANSGERHYRFVRGEFDVGEYSTATLLRGREKGLGFLGLPVFLDRGPCQRNIFHCEGKLTHPGELKGKKIGCFRYGATAVVWARGFLLDEYGLKTTDMDWYVSGQEVYIGQELPVEIERPNPPAPFGQERSHLAQRLSEGTLDIAIVAGDFGYLGIFGGGFLPGDMGKFPGVKPLLEDTDEIIRYIRNKRIYPMIHTIAIKQETAQRYPDLPAKLIEAFREAKNLSPQYMSPEETAGHEREKEVLGEDPYAYVWGETEKRTIQALVRYQIEQGLMKKSLPVEEIIKSSFVA